MQRIVVDATQPDRRAIAWAVEVLKAGGLVCFPTETVYGLGADMGSQAAVERLGRVKGAAAKRPWPLLVRAAEEAFGVCSHVPAAAALLAERLWPGPLTLVLAAKESVPAWVTAEDGTVGLRVPGHPVPLALLARWGAPLASSSANLAGQPPAADSDITVATLGEQIDLLLDAGKLPPALASTVVAFPSPAGHILREGAGAAEVKRLLGLPQGGGSA